MRRTRRLRAVLILTTGLVAGACGAGDGEEAAEGEGAGEVVFFSTQLAPVEEAEKVRDTILADFGGTVDFVGSEYGPWADRVNSEAEAGQGTVDLLGGLHGDFVALGTDTLSDLSDVMGDLSDRGFASQYVELAQLGTGSTYYIPWMQATYIVVAGSEALPYLPEGADVNALTYEQYAQWAKNIFDQTGQAKVGFPAGQGGLIHRFFQGYLVPAFTGGVVTTYTLSAPAWQWLADIWPYVHPQSVGFEFMQEPLLSGEVWVAWDHVARLKNALEQRPDDFVAVPAPAGPEGLAFMPVIAGLAIPETAPNQDGARELIHFLTETSTQAATLREVGFFPVVSGDLPGDLSAGIAAEAEAVTAQAGAPNALPSLLPIGLGERGGDFNKVYLDAFQRIILGGEDIQTVLTEEAQDLESIMQETQAPCWAPDPASDGPCPVG